MRQLARSYLQHGNRHLANGSDPIPGIGAITNDWAYSQTALGTVADGATVQGGFSSIVYQTDDGSVFGIDTSGTYDAVSMLQIGTYLVRAGATFPAGRTGTIQVGATIGGHVTTYDYDVRAGTSSFADIATGSAWWEQLCIVNDLGAPAGAFVQFTQTTGSPAVSCVGFIQIFRLT